LRHHPHTMTIRFSGFCRTSRTLPSDADGSARPHHADMTAARICAAASASPGNIQRQRNTGLPSQTLYSRSDQAFHGG
jgi:hypothetical protein